MNKLLKMAVTARLLLVGSLIVLSGAAVAVSPLSSEDYDGLVGDFLLGEADAQLVDVDQLEADVEAALPESDSVFLRGGQLSPLAKVLHALEAHDGRLERVRYALGIQRVYVEEPPAADPVPVLLIVVQRFNLGQLIRQELIDSVGAENVAEPGEFGVGPHVEWRFIARQLMGQEAMLLAASRRDLSPEEAAEADCLSGSCLSSAALIDSAAVWHDFLPADLGIAVPEFLDGLPYEAEAGGLPVSAAALDLAARLAGFDAYLAEAGTEAYASVERNLGQDASLDAVLVQGNLADDSLESVWTRVYGVGDLPLFSAQAYGCRRGDVEFAPVGEFCL